MTREGFSLPDNFTLTANTTLKVGDLQETITVTGQSPVVDVQRVQQTQVVSRELLDVLPTGKSYRSTAGLITAVRPHKQSAADSGSLAQNRNAHGMGTSRPSSCSMASRPTHSSSARPVMPMMRPSQEISYQTSANTADVGVGGLRANLVPRDGGNQFHGGGFFSDLEGRWQSDNNSDELRARGLAQQNTIKSSRDVNPWVAGPID